jgi:hypothetical protein
MGINQSIEQVLYSPQDNCKKMDIFIHKNSTEVTGCFTANNNLGRLSDIRFDTLQAAILNYSASSYTRPVFVKQVIDDVYLSYEDEYVPVMSSHIARQETSTYYLYRYLVMDAKGKLLKAVTIKKIYK